jgi:hypothetical protein
MPETHSVVVGEESPSTPLKVGVLSVHPLHVSPDAEPSFKVPVQYDPATTPAVPSEFVKTTVGEGVGVGTNILE